MIQQKDVMIALKNGQTKYGLLLNKVVGKERETWNFIDYANIKSYTITKDQTLIEILNKNDIKFIALELR